MPPPLPPAIQTFVKFRDFEELYPRWFSNLAILLILRRSFQWYLSMSKVEKTVKRSILKAVSIFIFREGSRFGSFFKIASEYHHY